MKIANIAIDKYKRFKHRKIMKKALAFNKGALNYCLDRGTVKKFHMRKAYRNRDDEFIVLVDVLRPGHESSEDMEFIHDEKGNFIEVRSHYPGIASFEF